MKVQDLITAAEKGGMRYEINFSTEYSGEGSRKEIGIHYMNNVKGSIWAWWTFYDDETGREYALFRSTYNQHMGRETKGWKRGMSVERQLQKILDKK